ARWARPFIRLQDSTRVYGFSGKLLKVLGRLFVTRVRSLGQSQWSDQPPIRSTAGYAANRRTRGAAPHTKGVGRMSKIRFIGLDVHADTISVAIAEPDNGEVRSLGVILNQPEQVRKLMRKLGPAEDLQACYEAGPTGYGLYWQLTELGVNCAVIAPTLTPTKPGDRVKTNRRDAEKLARCHRAGDLTPVWVPDAAHEALRDLVRAREDAREDQQRARQRLGKFLLRHGWQRPKDIKENWTQKHMAWIKSQVRFQQPASQAAFLDYVHEVEHAADRLQTLEKAIDDVIATAPAEIQEVVQALQAL